jgi:hypothetical protein
LTYLEKNWPILFCRCKKCKNIIYIQWKINRRSPFSSVNLAEVIEILLYRVCTVYISHVQAMENLVWWWRHAICSRFCEIQVRREALGCSCYFLKLLRQMKRNGTSTPNVINTNVIFLYSQAMIIVITLGKVRVPNANVDCNERRTYAALIFYFVVCAVAESV